MSRSPIRIPPIPKIPPTPAPKTVDNIHDEAKDRFCGITYIQKDNSIKHEDHFMEYDHWEPYSETKSYSKRPYQAAYKGIMKEYQNHLFILHTDDDEEYFVVARRIKSELEHLEPYCQCSRCLASIINPLKYLWCPYCTHCIKSGPGFAKIEYINKARELKELANKIQPHHTSLALLQKFLDKIPIIKLVEIIIIFILIIFWLVLY